MTPLRYAPGDVHQRFTMGVMIWDFPMRASHRPSQAECEAAEQLEPEERGRLNDEVQDEDESVVAEWGGRG